jgi:flagellar protein FliO/FliZ
MRMQATNRARVSVALGRTLTGATTMARRRGLTCALAAALGASFGRAAAQGPNAASDGPSLVPMALVLLLVLALIPVSLWLLKRIGAGTPAQSAGLQVVAQLALGPRERIVVVAAGERWLLLGVTAASIHRIGTLPKGETPPTATASAFAALLAKMQK